jgi:Tachylectin
LRWYRDANMNGTAGRAPNSGSQIGIGWDAFSHVFSGEDGVLYAIRPTGELLWYKDEKRNGTNGANAETGWNVNSGTQIGIGWGDFMHVFPAGDGLIYAVRPTGELVWFRDEKQDGMNGPRAETGWYTATDEAALGTEFDAFDLVFSGGWPTQH